MTTVSTIGVTMDCADPDVAATFWETFLDYRRRPTSPDSRCVTIERPERSDGIALVTFQRVPEPKTTKARVTEHRLGTLWHRGSVDDDVIKAHLHQKLRAAREALVWKLDGLSEHDGRRPLTPTGANLLGLVKHNAISDARYFGDVFDRPFPEPLPRWDDPAADFVDHWATEQESRAEILDLARRVWIHSDATIEALDLDDRGYVPWWQEEVPLLNVMAARLVDSVRHAGHADVLRESLDGAVGIDAGGLPLHGRNHAYWSARRALIDDAARAADPSR